MLFFRGNFLVYEWPMNEKNSMNRSIVEIITLIEFKNKHEYRMEGE